MKKLALMWLAVVVVLASMAMVVQAGSALCYEAVERHEYDEAIR